MSLLRLCQEPGCGEPAYGPRAKRCHEHHRQSLRDSWNSYNARKRGYKPRKINGMCVRCKVIKARAPRAWYCERCAKALQHAAQVTFRVDERIRRRKPVRTVLLAIHRELTQILDGPEEFINTEHVRTLGSVLMQVYSETRPAGAASSWIEEAA